MPPGEEVTVPVPLPAFSAVTTYCLRAKVAVTSVAPVSITVQSPVPAQPPPDQPTKYESLALAAVRVMVEPWSYSSAQSLPQSRPWGREVTVPEPLPALATVS